MSVVAVRDAIVSTIRAALKEAGVDNVSVVPHFGRWDEEDVKRLAPSLPAILVTAAAIGDLTSRAGEAVGYVTWVVTAIAGERQAKRDEASMMLACEVAALLETKHNRWGLEGKYGIGTPVRGRCVNATTPKLDKGFKLSVWFATWEQLQAVKTQEVGNLADFLFCHSEMDIDGDGVAEATDEIALGGTNG